MSTVKEKQVAFQLTRLVIFLLGSLAIFFDAPLGDILGVISLAMWLWMPQLILIELKLINKFGRLSWKKS